MLTSSAESRDIAESKSIKINVHRKVLIAFFYEWIVRIAIVLNSLIYASLLPIQVPRKTGY